MSRSRSSSSSRKSRRSNRSQSSRKQKRRQRSESNQRSQKAQNTCLYLGNLDRRLSEQKLQQICSEYGKFQYCYIVFQPTSHHDRNKQTKVSRGYGFVKYNTTEDALKAKQALNGKQVMSRKVNAEISKRSRPRQSTPGQYLGRRRSPPRRERNYRRRSYSRSSSGQYRRRRKYSNDRERKHREHKDRRRERSRSAQKKHKKRRQSRQNSPRK